MFLIDQAISEKRENLSASLTSFNHNHYNKPVSHKNEASTGINHAQILKEIENQIAINKDQIIQRAQQIEKIFS